MVRFHVRGLRELDRALRQLKPATAKNVLKRAGKAALEPVADRAQALAPVAEGNLRDSIVVGTQLAASARRKERRRRETRTGVTIYAGTANRNAVPREFGTSRSAASPFLRPAWDALNGAVLDDVVRRLGIEIERAAARAARGSGRSRRR